MPFTLSHPAAAWICRPVLNERRLPLAPFVIGTMTPDFEFFLHLRPLALWSHSLAGLIYFCLPVGAGVTLLWYRIVRAPVLALFALPNDAPEPRGSRPAAVWGLRVATAILLGAATHLLWDGVTHGGYWGAKLLPVLRQPVFSLGGAAVPWANLLQHVSTIVGGLAVLIWLARRLQAASSFARFRRSRWRQQAVATIVSVSLVAGVLNGLAGRAAHGYWGMQVVLGRVAVGALLGLALAVTLWAVKHSAAPPRSEA